MMKDKKELLGHLACFATYTIFGINVVTCKDLTGSHILSPVGLFSIRALGAGGAVLDCVAFLSARKSR